MITVRFRLTGTQDAINAADTAERLFLLKTKEVLEWFGSTVVAAAQSDHPYTDHTGNLTRSIGYTVETWAAGRIEVNVFALADYADEVEYGRPGARAYPFLFPKFYYYLEEAQFRLFVAMEEAFREATRLYG